MSDFKGRYWSLVTYLDENQIKKVVLSNSNIKRYAYVRHDRDKTATGDLKALHYHIILYLYDSRTLKQVRNLFGGFYDDNQREISTLGQRVGSRDDVLDYLIHKNSPDKFQYDFNDIVSNGIDDMYNEHTDEDNTYEIINAILNRKPLRELVKLYGRNFVFHYSSFKQVCLDIKRQEYELPYLEMYGLTKDEIDELPYLCKDEEK